MQQKRAKEREEEIEVGTVESLGLAIGFVVFGYLIGFYTVHLNFTSLAVVPSQRYGMVNHGYFLRYSTVVLIDAACVHSLVLKMEFLTADSVNRYSPTYLIIP